MSTISRLGVECRGRAKLRLLIICPVEVKNRYPMDTYYRFTQNWMLV